MLKYKNNDKNKTRNKEIVIERILSICVSKFKVISPLQNVNSN